MTKKQSIVTICVATLLIALVTIGSAYAYWRQTLVQTGTNELTTGCFNISLTEEQNEINLQKAFPISDEAGRQLTPFTFKVTNTCDTASAYTVNLEMLAGTTLSTQYVDVLVNDGEIRKLNSLPSGTKNDSTSVESRSIDSGVLKLDESKEFSIRLWLDKDVTLEDDAQNKVLKSKIVITSEATEIADTSSYTIVTDKNGNGIADIGDEIALGEEHFYVISNDGTTLNALAKYNLNAGGEYNGSWTAYENPTYKQDAEMRGLVSGESIRKGTLKFSNTNGWPYSNNDTIDIQAYDGPVKTAINAYKEILPEGVEVRLITKAELEGLGCDSSNRTCSSAPVWIYSTSYWSGSASAGNANYVWLVYSDGNFLGNSFVYGSGSCGVRPVISLES